MKKVGIVRNIDSQGRVVIPMEFRRTLNIAENDLVEISADDEGAITVKKYHPEGALAKAVSDLHNTLIVFGGQLSADDSIAMHEHIYAMKKLINKE
jgi:transcriptional pleiotropic regulator of transition state genes